MVRTRSGKSVESTDKAFLRQTPDTQGTVSTTQITTDDSSDHGIVETSSSLEEGASSSSAMSKTICSTPSCPMVEAEVDLSASAVSFRRRRYSDDSCTSSVDQRVTRSRSRALAKNSSEVLESSSKNAPASGKLDDSSRRSKRSRKELFKPVYELAEELTDVHSPVSILSSTQGGETPCSSRTGSGYSSYDAPSTRSSFRSSTVCVEDAVEAIKQDEASNSCSIPEDNSLLASEITVDPEEKPLDVDVTDVDTRIAQSMGPVHEAGFVETKPSVEISTLVEDSQEEADLQVGSFHVTPDQQHDFEAGSVPEKRKVISLLDCSDEDEESDEEDQEKMEVSEEERCKSTKVAAVSVDGLFMIDTRPGSEVDDQYYKEGREGEEAGTSKGVEEEEFVDEDENKKGLTLFSRRDSHMKGLSSSIDPGINVKDFGGLYVNLDGSSSRHGHSSLQKQMQKKIHDDLMKKSVIGPDFEKKDAVPPNSETKRSLKLKRKAEREKSTGEAWFNMKSPELTQELKADLKVLKMRDALDSKRFYKKNDRDGNPKFFQLGTVVDSPIDYHSRIHKKKRKSTMVEELLADAEFRQNNKKKYQHILSARGASYKKKKTNHKP